MTDHSDTKRDDGRVWGHIEDGVFWALPKSPLINAQMGPPPFDVTLPSGKIRHVVHQPEPTVTAIPLQTATLPAKE